MALAARSDLPRARRLDRRTDQHADRDRRRGVRRSDPTATSSRSSLATGELLWSRDLVADFGARAARATASRRHPSSTATSSSCRSAAPTATPRRARRADGRAAMVDRRRAGRVPVAGRHDAGGPEPAGRVPRRDGRRPRSADRRGALGARARAARPQRQRDPGTVSTTAASPRSSTAGCSSSRSPRGGRRGFRRRRCRATRVELGGRVRSSATAVPAAIGDQYYGVHGATFSPASTRGPGNASGSRGRPAEAGLVLVNDRLVIFAAHGRLVVAKATPEGYGRRRPGGCSRAARTPGRASPTTRLLPQPASRSRPFSSPAGPRRPTRTCAARVATDGAFGRFVPTSIDVRRRKATAIDAYLAAARDDADRRGRPRALRLPRRRRRRRHRRQHVERAVPIRSSASPGRISSSDRTVSPRRRVEYRYQVDLERWEPDPLNPHRVPGAWGDSASRRC